MGEKLKGDFTVQITGHKEDGPVNSRYFGVIIEGEDRNYGKGTHITLKMCNDPNLPKEQRKDFYNEKKHRFNGKDNDIQTDDGSIAPGRGGESFPNPFMIKNKGGMIKN
jgi:hypothetical protein